MLLVLGGLTARAQSPIVFQVITTSLGMYSSDYQKYIFEQPKSNTGRITVRKNGGFVEFYIQVFNANVALTVMEELLDNYLDGDRQIMYRTMDSAGQKVDVKVIKYKDGTYGIYSFYKDTAISYRCYAN